MHILNPKSANWSPPVITYSALTGTGIDQLWGQVVAHRERMEKTGEHAALRREQQVKWMWSMLNERVFARLKSDSHVRARLPAIEAAVQGYASDVRSRAFPGPEHTYEMKKN